MSPSPDVLLHSQVNRGSSQRVGYIVNFSLRKIAHTGVLSKWCPRDYAGKGSRVRERTASQDTK